MEALWRRPEWTDPPKGYDVPARAGWFPIVTGVQEVADLMAGFSAASGYGHNYGINFVTGWAAPAAHPDRVGPRWPDPGWDGSVAPWLNRSGTCSLSPRVNSLVGSRR